MRTDVGIRDADPRDYARLVEIYNQWYSEPISHSEFVTRETKQSTGAIKHRWVAELPDGTLAGTGHVRRWQQFAPGMFLTTVVVEASWRGRGYGQSMQAHLEEWVAAHGGTWMVTLVRDSSERDHRVVKENGFRFLQHLFESKVNLQGFDLGAYADTLERLAANGLSIVRYSDLEDSPENRARLHHAYSTSDLDTPGIENWGVSDHSHFEEEFFGADWYNPDYVTIALSGEEIVGVSVIAPTEEGQWFTDYTGVLREYRGKGLALAMKATGLHAAQAAGAQSVRTNNDSNNAPMLAVNRKLGFEPEPGWIYLRKDL